MENKLDAMKLHRERFDKKLTEHNNNLVPLVLISC